MTTTAVTRGRQGTATETATSAADAGAAGSAAPPPALTEAWEALRHLVYNNNRRAEVSKALGLSFFHIKALRQLLTSPMRMRELAAALMTDKPYVTQIVDALEKRGLVTRTVDLDDRRCRIAALTETGRAEAQRAEEILNRPPAGLCQLPEQDLADLARILGKLPEHGTWEP